MGSLLGLSTVSQPKCVSINGILPLMESVWLGPKVIPLSGAHCISFIVIARTFQYLAMGFELTTT
jgi:hypothetical protein